MPAPTKLTMLGGVEWTLCQFRVALSNSRFCCGLDRYDKELPGEIEHETGQQHQKRE